MLASSEIKKGCRNNVEINEREVLSNLYISFFISASILFFEKEEYSGAELYCFEMDVPSPPAQPSPSESMEAIMKALIQYMPDYVRTVSETAPEYERNQLNLSRELAPQQSQLALDIFEKYGPEFNRIGNEIMQQNAMAKAQSDANILSGPGMELVEKAREAERVYDPLKEQARENALRAANELISGISSTPNGSELAEIERFANRQSLSKGTYNTPSRTETLKTAMDFGNALQQRKAALSQQLAGAAQTVAGLTKPVDVFSVATGRPVMVNPGESRYLNPNMNSYSTSSNVVGGMFNSLSNLQQAAMGNTASMYGTYANAMASQKSPFETTLSGLGSLGGFLWGNSGAFGYLK